MRSAPEPGSPQRIVGPGFHARVHALVATVPPGFVTTYGDVATALGSRNVARHVGIATTIGGTDHRQDRMLAAGSNRVEWRVTVEQPDLWFPRALGDPTLVDACVEVVDAATGSTSDERRLRTGLR